MHTATLNAKDFIEKLELMKTLVPSSKQDAHPILKTILVNITGYTVTLNVCSFGWGSHTQTWLPAKNVHHPYAIFGVALGKPEIDEIITYLKIFNPPTLTLGIERETASVTILVKNDLGDYIPAPELGWVPGVDGDEFPQFEWPEKLNALGAYPLTRFREDFERVIPATAKDDSRPILSGMYTEFSEDRFRMICADGYRCHAGGTLPLREYNDHPSFVIPPGTLQKLFKKLKPSKVDTGDPDVIAFGESEGTIYYAIPRYKVRGTLMPLEGTFPDFMSILPPLEETLRVQGQGAALKKYIPLVDTPRMTEKDYGAVTVHAEHGAFSLRRGDKLIALPFSPHAGDSRETQVNLAYLKELSAFDQFTLYLPPDYRPLTAETQGILIVIAPFRR